MKDSVAHRTRECPGCSGNGVRLVPGVGLPFTAKTRKESFSQAQYQIYDCDDCGLKYRDPIPSVSDLARLYDDIDFTQWEVPGLFPPEKYIVSFLLGLPEGGKVLDFGCSTGRLLSRVVHRHRCFGYEINREAGSQAAAKGIEILDDLDGHAGRHLQFDVILLIDVFEHLEKPLHMIKKLYGLTKPGGHLVVSTGNADCWAAQADLANFWYFRTIQHLCMLTKKHAMFLARYLAMDMIVWKEISHYDVGILERAIQCLRHLIFCKLRFDPKSIGSALIRCMPVIKRAAKWQIPPPYAASNDHVIIIYRKPSTSSEIRYAHG